MSTWYISFMPDDDSDNDNNNNDNDNSDKEMTKQAYHQQWFCSKRNCKSKPNVPLPTRITTRAHPRGSIPRAQRGRGGGVGGRGGGHSKGYLASRAPRGAYSAGRSFFEGPSAPYSSSTECLSRAEPKSIRHRCNSPTAKELLNPSAP